MKCNTFEMTQLKIKLIKMGNIAEAHSEDILDSNKAGRTKELLEVNGIKLVEEEGKPLIQIEDCILEIDANLQAELNL